MRNTIRKERKKNYIGLMDMGTEKSSHFFWWLKKKAYLRDMKNKNTMEHQTINYNEDKDKYIEVCLNMIELKMLYNACIDIVNQHPSMVGYEKVAMMLNNEITEPIEIDPELPF